MKGAFRQWSKLQQACRVFRQRKTLMEKRAACA